MIFNARKRPWYKNMSHWVMNIKDTLRRLSFRTKTALSIITILLLLGISLSIVISRNVSGPCCGRASCEAFRMRSI